MWQSEQPAIVTRKRPRATWASSADAGNREAYGRGQGHAKGRGKEALTHGSLLLRFRRALQAALAPDMGIPSRWGGNRPMLRGVRTMRHRLDRSPPCDAHHLRRLVGHHVPAFRRQRTQARRHMGRHQVMKDNHCGCFEIGRASERIPGRSLPVVVAVDERERPSGARFAQSDDRRGAHFGNENRRRASAGAADRLLEFAPPVRIREQRFDDMERRNAGGDEMGGRPAAPRADLDSAPPLERARVAIEDRSFVAIDEADRRIASVDPKRMVDLLAKIGPSRGALVRLDHVRKEMIENRRFKIGGDVVLSHGWNL